MKNNELTIFIIISGLLVVFLSLFIIYSIKFSFYNISLGKAPEILEKDSQSIIRINFEGLKKIGIMKE